MCGRYQLEYGIDQLMMRFDARNNYLGYGTKKEIFPTDSAAVILRKEKQNIIELAKWGLNNKFDKRPLINARGETVDEKTTFKNMFINSRCIIPATGFFEWKTENNKKIKFQICPSDSEIFPMAGLYRLDIDTNGNPIIRFVIITAAANEAMSQLHERMPVILTKENEQMWMDNSIKDTTLLKEFIKSYAGPINITPVNKNIETISFLI
jgi:putative SOS response-associated peptidase YedK